MMSVVVSYALSLDSRNGCPGTHWNNFLRPALLVKSSTHRQMGTTATTAHYGQEDNGGEWSFMGLPK